MKLLSRKKVLNKVEEKPVEHDFITFACRVLILDARLKKSAMKWEKQKLKTINTERKYKFRVVSVVTAFRVGKGIQMKICIQTCAHIIYT